MLLFITKIKANALTDFTKLRNSCYFRGAGILIFFRMRYRIDYSVLCVIFTSSFKWRFVSWKYRYHLSTQNEAWNHEYQTFFQSFISPVLKAALFGNDFGRSLIIPLMRNSKGSQTCSLLLNCLEKKNFFFFCEKRRKQSKRKQKSTCSDFDGCLESFEYTNFKSLEKFHKPFCKWKEHMLKKPKRADATSKESVYIPTFSQNKAVCPFKEHFPKKILLQNKELMPGSSLFPPVFWFA